MLAPVALFMFFVAPAESPFLRGRSSPGMAALAVSQLSDSARSLTVTVEDPAVFKEPPLLALGRLATSKAHVWSSCTALGTVRVQLRV